MKIETRAIASTDIFRDSEKKEKKRRKKEKLCGVRTSQSGRSVLIKRTRIANSKHVQIRRCFPAREDDELQRLKKKKRKKKYRIGNV